MPIDYSRLRNLTAREVIRALGKDGFTFDRQTGSHQLYYHDDGRRVMVAFHAPGDTFKIKTLKAMIELQARWTEADMVRLGLLR
jgi:predicted RNA binding protein YcfA (HicA-like mRNA interferase family)